MLFIWKAKKPKY